MPERQLQLFEPVKPFLEHVGPAFFTRAPKLPGVYVMTGEDERVLYIGQSSNLKSRLASYKNSRRDATHRKTLRLGQAVRTITYEICDSAEAALVREKKLIALHKPRFNRAGVMPRPATFISATSTDSKLELSLNEKPAAGVVCGPLSSGGRSLFAAICRSLWNLALHFPPLETFPAGLLSSTPPPKICIPLPAVMDIPGLATDFLSGSSHHLIEQLKAVGASRGSVVSNCQLALHQEDTETLERFYKKILQSPPMLQKLENPAGSL